LPIAFYLSIDKTYHSLSLSTYRETLSLLFIVRKTLRLEVYVTSISNDSILHNSRQQTVTNDNKREQVHPTKIIGAGEVIPNIKQ
jgi:hypothetical protein